mgnify:CR=1 FL=1
MANQIVGKKEIDYRILAPINNDLLLRISNFLWMTTWERTGGQVRFQVWSRVYQEIRMENDEQENKGVGHP